MFCRLIQARAAITAQSHILYRKVIKRIVTNKMAQVSKTEIPLLLATDTPYES